MPLLHDVSVTTSRKYISGMCRVLPIDAVPEKQHTGRLLKNIKDEMRYLPGNRFGFAGIVPGTPIN